MSNFKKDNSKKESSGVVMVWESRVYSAAVLCGIIILLLSTAFAVFLLINTNAGSTSAGISAEKADLDLKLPFEKMMYGETRLLEVEGNLGGGEVTYFLELSSKESGRAELNGNSLTATHIGKIRVRVEVAETENYNRGSLDCIIEITNRRLVLTETSDYDFWYEWEDVFENGIINNYRISYKNPPEGLEPMVHGVDDFNLNHNFVLGRIKVETSITDFLANITPECLSTLKLYDNTGKPVWDSGKYVGEYEQNHQNVYIGTGWYILTGEESEYCEKVRLCVLGDVDGNGKIDVDDSTKIANVVMGEDELTEIEFRLAAYVVNVGNVNAADYAAVNTVIGGINNIEDYFRY